MTGNQRRTGLRMPWTSAPGDGGDSAAPTPTEAREPTDAPAATPAETVEEQPAPVVDAAHTVLPPSAEAGGDPPDAFMRGLVEAMRKVADEAKHA